MRRNSWFKSTAFLIVVSVAVVCSGGTSIRAQQPDATKFNQTYESAVAKAHEECHALWADPAFDPIRGRAMGADSGDPAPRSGPFNSGRPSKAI
jgi:hypothetical protein